MCSPCGVPAFHETRRNAQLVFLQPWESKTIETMKPDGYGSMARGTPQPLVYIDNPY